MINKNIAYYSEKDNTVMIRTDIMMPNTNGMSWNEHCKAINEAFNMTILDRIAKFTPPQYMDDIIDLINKHADAKIGEFTYA